MAVEGKCVDEFSRDNFWYASLLCSSVDVNPAFSFVYPCKAREARRPIIEAVQNGHSCSLCRRPGTVVAAHCVREVASWRFQCDRSLEEIDIERSKIHLY